MIRILRRSLGRFVILGTTCWLLLQLSKIFDPKVDMDKLARPDSHEKLIPDNENAEEIMEIKMSTPMNTLSRSASMPPSPFPEAADGPVLVSMVTYQRSGSSFLGEIFNQNPSAFEWFEPLDGLYSAMYGTEFGHNVASDIWNHWDGTPRSLPHYEIEALARVAKDILLCRFTDLPTEVLLHQFIGMFINEHKRMQPYYQCTTKKPLTGASKKLLTTCKRCNTRLAKFCGKRFGQAAKQSKCAQLLLPGLFHDPSWDRTVSQVFNSSRSVDKDAKKAVDNYKVCMQGCREKAFSCLPHLASACEPASLRAIKPVRFSMEAAQHLQEILPQVKIIQNLRDPRGVVFSRSNTSSSFQAVYAGALLKPMNKKHDMVKEAELFCRNALADVKLFGEMSRRTPDSLLQVVYENYAQQPEKTAQRVYRFLNLTVPAEVYSWLDVNTRNGTSHRQTTRNSTLTSSRWQRSIKPDKKVQIQHACYDFFSFTGSLWDWG